MASYEISLSRALLYTEREDEDFIYKDEVNSRLFHKLVELRNRGLVPGLEEYTPLQIFNEVYYCCAKLLRSENTAEAIRDSRSGMYYPIHHLSVQSAIFSMIAALMSDVQAERSEKMRDIYKRLSQRPWVKEFRKSLVGISVKTEFPLKPVPFSQLQQTYTKRNWITIANYYRIEHVSQIVDLQESVEEKLHLVEWLEQLTKQVCEEVDEDERNSKRFQLPEKLQMLAALKKELKAILSPAIAPTFRNLIQYEDPDRLLEWLHQRIDGRRGRDVGTVLLYCLLEMLITRKPTQKEFLSEFTLNGSWQAIHKYMDRENTNACLLARDYVFKQ